jgi:hypothetical protein
LLLINLFLPGFRPHSTTPRRVPRQLQVAHPNPDATTGRHGPALSNVSFLFKGLNYFFLIKNKIILHKLINKNPNKSVKFAIYNLLK